MRLGGVTANPRKLAAAVVAVLGLGLFALVTVGVGVEVGLVLLAAGVGGGLLVAVRTYRRMMSHNGYVAGWERARGLREQEAVAARQAEVQELRASLRELRWSTDTGLAQLDRVGRQVQTLALWRRAELRRDQAGFTPETGRDGEVALIRDSGLFDAEDYQAQAGVRVADPVGHYVDQGASAGVEPHRAFSTAAYLERYPDALRQWRTPLAHFLAAERDPAVVFTLPIVRRDTAGRPDEADLRWDYLARGLHREPDTFAFYRIIGNDLPPRHRPGQSIENLRFILQHEPELPGCEKRFVVNRIVDPRVEKQIIALLEEHGMAYLHIPFVPDEYRRIGWRFDEFPGPGFTFGPDYERLSPGQQQRVLDHVYHNKNLYVMHNNGARNAALREGRRVAKWVLPWDGNCFLTRRAWDDLVRGVTEQPHLRYFTVPMARVLDNRVLLRPDPVVDASEEPQLLFRRDAGEEFDPDARYGRRPKVELFFRLGIPGPWDTWGQVQWDTARRPLSPEAGQVGRTSWVARLFSGEQRLEADSAGRQWRRIEAIWECVNRVDQDLAREIFDAGRLFALDEPVLERQREAYRAGGPGATALVGQLIATARTCLAGRVKDRLRTPADDIAVLTLAGYFTGERQFAERAAAILRAGVTGRRPALPPEADHTGLPQLLDAARLLARDGFLTAPDTAALRGWVTGHRQWLRTGEPGRIARTAADHHGTWYDVTVAALDAYLDDVGGVLATLRRSYDRVGQQFGANGAQIVEPRTSQRVGNLAGWLLLARYAERVGQDLWGYRNDGGGGIAGGLRRLISEPDADGERCAALVHLAGRFDPSLPDTLPEPQRDPWQLRPVFGPDDQLRPFWWLGG